MNKAKRDATEIPIRIYQARPISVLQNWLFLWLFIVPYLAICMIPVYLSITENYGLLVSGDYTQYYFIILALIPFFIYLAYRSHYLAIYENGIMLSTPLKKVFASWEDLKSLEGWDLVTNDDIDETVKGKQNRISLSKYSKGLVPQGQLMADLRHFAPQLFDAGEKSKNQYESDSNELVEYKDKHSKA